MTAVCREKQIALLADGFVVARQGGTVVMVSAVSDRKEMDESGFLPLSVDYREKVRGGDRARKLCFLGFEFHCSCSFVTTAVVRHTDSKHKRAETCENESWP